jgi:hypothetical protein
MFQLFTFVVRASKAAGNLCRLETERKLFALPCLKLKDPIHRPKLQLRKTREADALTSVVDPDPHESVLV